MILVLLLGLLAAADDEFDRYVADQERQIRDARVSVADREGIALNLAITLDRSAQSASTAALRRSRWSQAVAVLDRFNRDQPRHPRAEEFELQAAVYVWAIAQSWLREAEFEPRKADPKQQAARGLDDAIRRLSSLHAARPDGADLLSQNVRYRLARALSDRAGLVGTDRPKDREAALRLLETPIDEPTLRGHALLLRAEVQNDSGQFAEALRSVEEAATSKLPPPGPELLDARVDALIGLDRLDPASEAARTSADSIMRSILELRIALSQLNAAKPGPSRDAVERAAFTLADSLRRSGDPRSRRPLQDLARLVREPSPNMGPEAWDVLADGKLALGVLSEAAALLERGAKVADIRELPDVAASLRYRAGASWFQEGEYRRSADILAPILASRVGVAIRARAGLLRALALGRGSAARQAGISKEAYRRALDDEIRDFPDDPSGSEARWLLGLSLAASGDRPGAAERWKAIPRGHPRGLESRLAEVGLAEEELLERARYEDPSEQRRRLSEARDRLRTLLSESRDANERARIEFARARLETAPIVGDPEESRLAGDRALGLPHAPDLDRRIRLVLAIAQARTGRFLDAEQALRSLVSSASSSELLEGANRLDRIAAASDSDAEQRRIGQLLRVLIPPLLDPSASLSPEDHLRVLVLDARSLAFRGSPDDARAALSSRRIDPDSADLSTLHDLAELYDRLEMPLDALALYRRLADRQAPGSVPWFESRLGQAAALDKSKQYQAARRLIEATSLLHPDLGGTSMKRHFDDLLTRLNRR